MDMPRPVHNLFVDNFSMLRSVTNFLWDAIAINVTRISTTHGPTLDLSSTAAGTKRLVVE